MAVPKLRFKDENGADYPDWEKQKLGNIALITKLAGFEFTKYVTYKETGKIIAIRGLNVKQGKLVLDDVKYIDGSDFSKLSRSKLIIGDILFTYVGTVGECAIIDENNKYYLAPNVALIRLQNVNSKFVNMYIQSSAFKREIRKYIASSSQDALSMENIRKFIVSIPTSYEQKKIADFLTTFDKRITAQQNIVADMEETKKGLLQKIFSQEIRFKNDNGEDYPEWKEHYWKDDVKSIETGTPLTGAQNQIGIPLIKMGNIQNGKFILDKLEYVKPPITNYDKYVIKKGDFFFNTRNTMELVGKGATWFYDSEKYIFNSNIARVKFNNINTTFWNYLYNTELFKNQIHARATGTTSVAAIYPRYMNNIKYKLPCLEEQNKIASFLSTYDKKIEAEKKILADLLEMKKGLLQQMFV